MLPRQTESLKALRKRLPAALEDVYTPGQSPRPGEQRKHVFDLENGVRLIISRDRLDSGKAGIHISASAFDGDLELIDVMDAIESVTDITPDRRDIKFISEAGIPHFIFPDVAAQA